MTSARLDADTAPPQRAAVAPATLTASELARMLQVSTWAIYEAVKAGQCPVPPIKVGRRIVFSKVMVDRLLGAEP